MANRVELRDDQGEIDVRRPPELRAVRAAAGGQWKVITTPDGQPRSPAGDGRLELTRAAGRDSLAPHEHPPQATVTSEDDALIAANQEAIAALRQQRYGAIYGLADLFSAAGRIAVAIGAVSLGVASLGVVSAGWTLAQGHVAPAFVDILGIVVGAIGFALAATLDNGRARHTANSQPAGVVRKRDPAEPGSDGETECELHRHYHALDATVEEVGRAGAKLGFDGKPLRRPPFEGFGPGI